MQLYESRAKSCSVYILCMQGGKGRSDDFRLGWILKGFH